MAIIKSVQFRKNLKKTLQSSYTDKVLIDYYGELFEIVPVKKDDKNLTQAQKLIAKYSKLKPRKLTDPIFNEADPTKEKENIRNLIYGKYDK